MASVISHCLAWRWLCRNLKSDGVSNYMLCCSVAPDSLRCFMLALLLNIWFSFALGCKVDDRCSYSIRAIDSSKSNLKNFQVEKHDANNTQCENNAYQNTAQRFDTFQIRTNLEQSNVNKSNVTTAMTAATSAAAATAAAPTNPIWKIRFWKFKLNKQVQNSYSNWTNQY